jgi:hypothetical protein
MTTIDYTLPDNPADPEAAACELIVRVPQAIAGGRLPADIVAVLHDLAELLHAEGCFAGLSWHDARHVAAAVAFDTCWHDDAAARHLRGRADRIADGADTMFFDDREGVARALTTAADLIGM